MRERLSTQRAWKNKGKENKRKVIYAKGREEQGKGK
jgi:hypothetical protein